MVIVTPRADSLSTVLPACICPTPSPDPAVFNPVVAYTALIQRLCECGRRQKGSVPWNPCGQRNPNILALGQRRPILHETPISSKCRKFTAIRSLYPR